jgi:hypothetical protein
MLGIELYRGKDLDDRDGAVVADGEEEVGVLAVVEMIRLLRILGREVNLGTLSNRVGDQGFGADLPVVRRRGIWPVIGGITDSKVTDMDTGGIVGWGVEDCLVGTETMGMAVPGVQDLGGLDPLGLVPAPVLVTRVPALVLPAEGNGRCWLFAEEWSVSQTED